MNLKKSLLVFFISFTINLVSQEQNITVNYNVYPKLGSIENDPTVKSNKLPDLYKGVDEALKYLEYELVINKNMSHFFLKDILYSDKKIAGLAIGFAGRDSFFCNKDSAFYQKTKYISGEKFTINYVPQTNWVLSSESKKIQGYTCYRATMSKTTMVKKDKFKTRDVEAWYCPELPFPFGPKDNFDLPGLILELYDDKVVFLATKIEFNSYRKIILENKKNCISEKEFYDINEVKTKEYFEAILNSKR